MESLRARHDQATRLLLAVLCGALTLTAILAWRADPCDGDTGRHILHGTWLFERKAFNGPGGTPPFPMMDLYSGIMGLLFDRPGRWITNLNFLAHFGGIFLFWRIWLRYRAEGMRGVPFLAAAALLAAHPIYVVAGTHHADHALTSFLALAAWAAASAGHPFASALVLGFSTGTRLTNILWALPLAWLLRRRFGWKPAIGFSAALALVCALTWDGVLLHSKFNPLALFVNDQMTEVQPLWPSVKTAVSKLLAFLGLPMLAFTAWLLRDRAARTAWVERLRAFPEIPLFLLFHLIVFIRAPWELAYLITAIPALALAFPFSTAPLRNAVAAVLVFAMNFALLEVQNGIPTKLHAVFGYWVGEYTCKRCDTILEPIRFSVPRRTDGSLYAPAGDWTTAAATRTRLQDGQAVVCEEPGSRP